METPTKEPIMKTEQAKARPPRKARPAAAKMPKKLLLFDVDLFQMVRSGNNTQDKMLLLTGVDPFQFAQRADFLCAKGFLCRDSANPSVFRLGLSGYDELAKRRIAEEKRTRKAKETTNTITAEAETEKIASHDAGNSSQPTSVQMISAAVPKLSSNDSPIVYIPGPEHKPAAQADIDLFDLLRKGSPKNGSAHGVAAKIKTAIAAAPSGKAMPFEKQVETLGGRDAVKEMIEETTQSGVCELCQAPFRLSVNPSENNPKYGYCFCGASYHKDCYEHLVNSQNSCLRCGKKLQIRMDKASEDAVRAIKKLFD